MEQIYKKARAKVNLTLNVLNKRDDGYHNIESIFQKISLYDEIIIKKSRKDKITIESNVKSLEGRENIIFKSYELLKNKFKNISGVEVELIKRIPMQAGIGGDSSDCGAFIECMNKLFKLDLNQKDMEKIGAELGADVPATFYNKPVMVRGVGEQISEIISKTKYYLVVIKPEFSCNTREMYEKLDKEKETNQKHNSNDMKKAIESNDIVEIANNLYNVFENVVEVEDIKEIKQELINLGAIGSLMSGSGSAVYGIFKEKKKAKEAFYNLNKKYKTYYCITY